jgi:hypothetical protein
MNDEDENTSNSSNSSSPIHPDDIKLNIETDITTNIVIDNVQEEINLINYTENHFNTKIQQDLEKIREFNKSDSITNSFYQTNYIRSNSPVTISNGGSRSGSSDSDSNNIEYDTDNEDKLILSNNGYKKLSYKETINIINKYYDLNNDNKFSNEIDILTTYVKAQKNLYIQANNITQYKLNCLMFPTILISGVITMIAPFIECTHWSGGVISGLNAIIMLCVSFMNYLKLESSIEIYLQNVKQYDKIETSLEMTNSKLLFIENDKEKTQMVLNKIKDLEKKMNEIKESTNILIPEEVKRLFPIIYHINIFSFIKKIEIYKKTLILKFKDVKNEIRYILYKLELDKKDTVEIIKHKYRLQFLYDVKNKLKDEILDFQNAYSHIDTIFTKEIKLAEIKKNDWVMFYFWRTPKQYAYTIGMNPMIDKYFQFIFVDE